MAIRIKKIKLAPIVMFVACASLLIVSGCSRYARNVNTHYDPSANIRGGSGEVYNVIPENRQSRSSDLKVVIGNVKDGDNNIKDEVFSPRSQSEISQEAFGLEFKR